MGSLLLFHFPLAISQESIYNVIYNDEKIIDYIVERRTP